VSAPDLTREDWLAKRERTVGSSEAAAVVGENPYLSPLELWAQKRGLIARPDLSDLRPVRLGRRLEPIVLDEYAHERGVRLLDPVADRSEIERILGADGQCEIVGWVEGRQPYCRSVAHPFMTATLDGVAVTTDGEPRTVEAKAVGWRQIMDWNAEGSAPDWYRLQVYHALAVVPALIPVGVLVALIGGSDYRDIHSARADAPLDALIELERAFVESLADGREPPADASESAKRALRALHPDDNGTTITLPVEALSIRARIAEIDEHAKPLDGERAALRAQLEQMIGDATYGELPDGAGRYSFKTTERAAYEVKATKYRVLRFSGAKAAKAGK